MSATSWTPQEPLVLTPVAAPTDIWSGNPETDKAWAHDAASFDAYFPGVIY